MALVTSYRLHTLSETHHNHHKQEDIPVHDTVRAYRQVPPYLRSCLLIKITTKQETAFIRNGAKPIANESTTIFFLKRKIPF